MGGVDDVYTGLHRLEVGHKGQASGRVGVQVDGQIHGHFDGGHQVVGFLGAHDTGHILDTDGGHAHGLQFLDHFYIVGVGMDGAGGVGDGAGGNGPRP